MYDTLVCRCALSGLHVNAYKPTPSKLYVMLSAIAVTVTKAGYTLADGTFKALQLVLVVGSTISKSHERR